MTIKIIVALAVIGALAGCETTTAVQEDYGNSLASLVKAQTANPETLTNPSTAAVTGVDPDYARAALGEMRKSVSKPQDIREPIEMVFLSGETGGQ
jgi:uncharacterized lipoprotein